MAKQSDDHFIQPSIYSRQRQTWKLKTIFRPSAGAKANQERTQFSLPLEHVADPGAKEKPKTWLKRVWAKVGCWFPLFSYFRFFLHFQLVEVFLPFQSFLYPIHSNRTAAWWEEVSLGCLHYCANCSRSICTVDYAGLDLALSDGGCRFWEYPAEGSAFNRLENINSSILTASFRWSLF